jgi:hypothetical protein
MEKTEMSNLEVTKMEQDIEVFADHKPITNETRRRCRVFRESGFENVEVWINDRLVYRSEEAV